MVCCVIFTQLHNSGYLPGVGGGPYRGGPGGGAPWCIVEGGGCKENGNVIKFNINVTQKFGYSI